ncbi:hypothetical protein NUU61_002724 [Penicillium alfredii]|uniref:Uncharacterized protein n=1 Tax=Penicillium alfredii TaxID=1506179 RepID=A0A9W9KHI0_9EURO|nr:uncharacterized protein NUU61_002724 [Penicillium alfredii]KAJ5105377.1 hypothetical protein NUU61_002724 [Penicillium alfredii]
MLAHTILVSLAGLALAVPFPDSNHHVAPRAKRDDTAIIASKCDSPCEIRFSAITTTMTVSAPPQTMNIDGIDHPVTVTFTPVTTATTLQPVAKTVENTDPAATPTISVDAVNLGSVTLFGSAYNYNWNVAAHAQMYTSPHPYVLANSMNPYHLDSNCAFVTMAKLMNMGLHPFLNMIGMMQNADHGISTTELKQALSEIRLHGNFMTWYVLTLALSAS